MNLLITENFVINGEFEISFSSKLKSKKFFWGNALLIKSGKNLKLIWQNNEVILSFKFENFTGDMYYCIYFWKKEKLEIRTSKIYLENIIKLSESLKIKNTKENSIRNYIIENANSIINEEFKFIEKEYRTPVGRLDIFWKIGDLHVLVEVKKDIGENSFKELDQVKRYSEYFNSIGVFHIPYLIAFNFPKSVEIEAEKYGIRLKKINKEHF